MQTITCVLIIKVCYFILERKYSLWTNNCCCVWHKMLFIQFSFYIFSIITKQNMTSIYLWSSSCATNKMFWHFMLSWNIWPIIQKSSHRLQLFVYLHVEVSLRKAHERESIHIFWSFGWRLYENYHYVERFSCLGFILSSLTLSLTLMIITWYLCSSLFVNYTTKQHKTGKIKIYIHEMSKNVQK